MTGRLNYSRRRPTFPHSFPCSIIGPEGLNFRVRDGNGCDPLGIATEKSVPLSVSVVRVLISKVYGQASQVTVFRYQLHCGFGLVCMFVVLYRPGEVALPEPYFIFMVKPHVRLVLVS